MTTIDHTTLEREARKLCESERGVGAWDKPRCQRNHWRKRVASIAVAADRTPYKTMMDSMKVAILGFWWE